MDDFPRFDLDGRVALVTGASRGLGRAIALALANAGADVGLGLHDAGGNSPAREIEALGRRTLVVQMDTLDLEQVGTAADAVVGHFGHLDILVNNAGVSPEDPAENVTEANSPTFIRTPGTEGALADPAFEAEIRERIAGRHQIGEPMDVAGAVVFLSSLAASLITGHTLLIDGGWTAQ